MHRNTRTHHSSSQTMPTSAIIDALDSPDAPLKATALATTLLVVKHILTVAVQGGARFESGRRPPEDAPLMPKAGAQDFTGAAKAGGKGSDSPALKAAIEKEARWTRIVQNDLENVPLGLIVAWGSLQSPKSPQVHVALVGAFALCRVFHTIAYAKKLQPHRAIVWFGAVLSMLGMAVNGLAGAFSDRK